MIPDEHFYLQATREFESGILDEALHAKAMALVDDDEQKFKKQYISLRVTQLKKNSATRGVSHVLIVVSTWAAWLWIIWCIGAAIVMPLTERGTAQIVGPIVSLIGAAIGWGALGLIRSSNQSGLRQPEHTNAR
jgi:hypothetical protein